MTVLVLGREGTAALLKDDRIRFVVGMIEQPVPDAAAHQRIAKQIEQRLMP